MKKILIGIISALCIMLCCLAFAGCGEPVDVAGKTFVYDSYKYEGEVPEGTDIQKDIIDQGYGQQCFIFDTEGKVECKAGDYTVASGTYTQDGSKLTVTMAGETMEFTVDGNKFSWTIGEENGNVFTVYYKVK